MKIDWEQIKDGALAILVFLGVCLSIGLYVFYQLFCGNGKIFGG